jgi:hypothetical protein
VAYGDGDARYLSLAGASTLTSPSDSDFKASIAIRPTGGARLELGSFCQKWGVRSSYVLSLTPSSTDRELNNEIRSALYLARTGTDIHLCYLGQCFNRLN